MAGAHNSVGGIGSPEPGTRRSPSSAWDDLSGQHLGRYVIRRRLGSGGVATVYQAYDQVQGQTVALKLLPPNTDRNTHQRFRREALMAGALRHPHIVRILQVGSAHGDGSAYIAMELIEGQSLAALLEQHGHLRPEESCNLLEPIARALAQAHEHSIIHRDVKPANILLRPVSPGMPHGVQLETLDHPVVPLLSDFGVARFLDAPELTTTGRTVGTPAYMAPEQCTGSGDVDGRVDIYSLGISLYRCIVGRLPFSGTSTRILHSHVHDPVMIDQELLKRVPAEVVEILQRSLAKQPQDRYESADEMAGELAHAAGRIASSHESPERQSTSMATATLTLTSVPASVSSPRGGAQALIVAGLSSDRNDNGENQPRPVFDTREIAGNGKALGVSNIVGHASLRHWAPSLWIAGLFFLAVVVGAMIVGGEVFSRVSNPPVEAAAQTKPAAILIAPTRTPTPVRPDRQVATRVIPPVEVEATNASGAREITAPTPTTTREATRSPIAEATTVRPAQPVTTEEETAQVAPIATSVGTVIGEDVAEPMASACTYVVDEHFVGALEGIDIVEWQGFGCATESAYTTSGEFLPFERGFILRLDENPAFYVYYRSTAEWERFVGQWREEESAVMDEGIDEPPGPGLYVPSLAYGRLWRDSRRRSALGHALEAQPIAIQAIVQTFPGGILIGNRGDDSTYVLLRSKLRF